jgi:hypothetical protein
MFRRLLEHGIVPSHEEVCASCKTKCSVSEKWEIGRAYFRLGLCHLSRFNDETLENATVSQTLCLTALQCFRLAMDEITPSTVISDEYLLSCVATHMVAAARDFEVERRALQIYGPLAEKLESLTSSSSREPVSVPLAFCLVLVNACAAAGMLSDTERTEQQQQYLAKAQRWLDVLKSTTKSSSPSAKLCRLFRKRGQSSLEWWEEFDDHQLFSVSWFIHPSYFDISGLQDFLPFYG